MRLSSLFEDTWASPRYYFHGTNTDDDGLIGIILHGLKPQVTSRWPAKEQAPRKGYSYITKDPRIALGFGQWIFVFDGNDIQVDQSEVDEDIICVLAHGSRSDELTMRDINMVRNEHPDLYKDLMQEIERVKKQRPVIRDRVAICDMVSKSVRDRLKQIVSNIAIPHVVHPHYLYFVPFRNIRDLGVMNPFLGDKAIPIPLSPIEKAKQKIKEIRSSFAIPPDSKASSFNLPLIDLVRNGVVDNDLLTDKDKEAIKWEEEEHYHKIYDIYLKRAEEMGVSKRWLDRVNLRYENDPIALLAMLDMYATGTIDTESFNRIYDQYVQKYALPGYQRKKIKVKEERPRRFDRLKKDV